jgi:hypothetical protein
MTRYRVEYIKTSAPEDTRPALYGIYSSAREATRAAFYLATDCGYRAIAVKIDSDGGKGSPAEETPHA